MSEKIKKEFEAYITAECDKEQENYEGIYIHEAIQQEFNAFVAGYEAAYKASRHDELVQALFKLAYPSGVETIERAERLQAQELLKSMEK